MAATLHAEEERDLAPQLPVASPSSELSAELEQPEEPLDTGSAPKTATDPAAASRQEAIARAAYFLAEARGFEPGHELDDWLAAEQQLTGIRTQIVLPRCDVEHPC